jgi:subtilisin family serine protease
MGERKYTFFPLVAVFISIFWVHAAVASRLEAVTTAHPIGRFTLSFSDNRVSLDSVQAGVDDILSELSQKTGIKIHDHQSRHRSITISFRKVSPEKAIQKLVDNAGFVYVKDPVTGHFRLIEVIITGRVNGMGTSGPSQASHTNTYHTQNTAIPSAPVQLNPAEPLSGLGIDFSEDSLSAAQTSMKPGELVVRFRVDTTDTEITRLLGKVGVSIKEHFSPLNDYLLALPEEMTVDQALVWFARQSQVESAEPNYLIPIQTIPNDPLFPVQWALNSTNTGIGPRYSGGMDMPAVWKQIYGHPGVVIAVVDTGVDYTHEDLAANIWKNPGEIPGLNGHVDDEIGWDFVDSGWGAAGEDVSQQDNDPMDRHGHGTMVSGIAAAAGNNQRGIAGIAWNCRVMALRAGYKTPSGGGTLESDDAARAIIYAAQNGAHVINLSWGSPYRSDIVARAIQFATDNGVIVCAAAGNQNSDAPYYPAALDNNGIISVGASDRAGSRAAFSNFGPWVDIYAPGTDIHSTYPNNAYARGNGTSMATAIVSGVAGLLWSLDEDLSLADVRSTLLQTTDQLSTQLEAFPKIQKVNATRALKKGYIISIISRFFRGCLQRNPSVEEVAFFSTALARGNLSGRNIARIFIFHPDFVGNNLPDEIYISTLYRVLLNREPEAIEIAGVVGNLRIGIPRNVIANRFLQSPEFHSLCRRYGVTP